jgi:antitoxin component of MazEF toxin-antitoxin module
MAKQKIIKTGHSLAVTIPSSFARLLGIKAGQEVEVVVESETGRAVYIFTGNKQLSLSSSLAKVKKNKK